MALQLLFPAGMWKSQSYSQRMMSLRKANLLAYYKCDDPLNGNILRDRFVNKYNGTPKNASEPVFGVTGMGDGSTAVQFNGVQYVNLIASGLQSVIVTTEGSISFWYQPDATILADGVSHYLFFLNIDANNQLWFRKQPTANQYAFAHLGSAVTKVASWSTSSTAWQHLVLTWSATAGKVTIWMNGEPGANPAPGIGNLTGTPVNLIIGATTTGGANSWKGKLAHLAIWNRAISIGDISVAANKNGVVIFDGDSRTIGTTSPYPTQCMALAAMTAKNYGWYNSGVSGETVANFSANAATEVDDNYRPSLSRNIVVVWGGVNDGAAGTNAATIYTRLVAYCQNRRVAGFKVIVCTEIDSQSVQSDAQNWHTVILPALNALIRANWSAFADGLADLGANTNLMDATNTTYFNVDKTHLTDTGYGVVAGIVKDQLVLM